MLVMDVFTRRIVGFGVEPAYIESASVCRMFNHVISGQPLPTRLSTDNDPLFRFHRWLANLRVLEIDEIKSVPYVPASHPLVERLIGTIRCEYLDRVFFWNSIDLIRKLGKLKKLITMEADVISHSAAARRRKNLVSHRRIALHSVATLGNNIARVFFKRR